MKKLIISAVLLLITACYLIPPRPEIDLADFSADEIARAIAARERSITSIKGMAKIKIQTPFEELSFKQVTIVQDPDLLYIEALTLFGTTVAKLIFDESGGVLMLPRDRLHFEYGEKFNLAYIFPSLPLSMDVFELVDLLLGRIPDGESLGDEELLLESEQGLLVLRPAFWPDRQKLYVNPENLLVERADILLNDGSWVTIEYGGWKVVGQDNAYFPSKIKLSTEKFSISVKYSDDTELNSPIDKTLFNQ